jgi:Ca2+-binding RTX toxin-like protein
MRLKKLAGTSIVAIYIALALAYSAPPLQGAQPVQCFGRPATIVRLGGDVDVHGTAKADVIVTGPGDDVIKGGGGNDRVCSAAGSDTVRGGPGADRTEAGAGDDSIEGGNGSDHLLGGPGRDELIGNRGNDWAFGEAGGGDFLNGGIGDDFLFGGPGAADESIGGIGNDKLYGNAGDSDLLRGDQGHDRFDGGPGEHDVASFATAVGQSGHRGGVHVELRTGLTLGDGNDHVINVEDVIGSPFGDELFGNSALNNLYGAGGNDQLRAEGPGDAGFGGGGRDSCDSEFHLVEPFAFEESCEREPYQPARVEVNVPGGAAASTLTAVFAETEIHSPLLGPPPPLPIHVTVSFTPGAWLVREEPLPVSAGEGCVAVTPSEARCPIEDTPRSLVVVGSPQDDTIEVDPNMPPYVSALLRGEEGDDELIGGSGEDTLEGDIYTGSPLGDTLLGRGGNDALVNGGALYGGAGSDLLIARTCADEQLTGGAGVDSVSFARDGVETPEFALRATLGGSAVLLPTSARERERECAVPPEDPTHIDSSVERIEGSRHDDILIGDSSINTLLGRGGDDVLIGRSGADNLVGGADHDRLFGDGGIDRLYGRDGMRDEAFNCGKNAFDEGIAILDPGDPDPVHCRLRG